MLAPVVTAVSPARPAAPMAARARADHPNTSAQALAAVAVLRRAHGAPRPLTDAESDALGVLYMRYAGTLRGVARRIVGDASEADDVVQDVFSRLPWIAAQYGTGGLGGWLKQVTARAALMRLRAARGRREDVDADECAAAVSDTADVVRADDECRVRRAVAGLPEPLRQVVALRAFAGYSHHEVAAALGITVNASQIRFCRAVQDLRARLAA